MVHSQSNSEATGTQYHVRSSHLAVISWSTNILPSSSIISTITSNPITVSVNPSPTSSKSVPLCRHNYYCPAATSRRFESSLAAGSEVEERELRGRQRSCSPSRWGYLLRVLTVLDAFGLPVVVVDGCGGGGEIRGGDVKLMRIGQDFVHECIGPGL